MLRVAGQDQIWRGTVFGMAKPTPWRKRLLASELKRIREKQAKMTIEQAAERAGMVSSSISRIETAQNFARPVVVRALCGVYGVSAEETESLFQLARDVKKKGWWHKYGDVIGARYADYISLEAEATAIRNYEPQFIPGLLQIEEYAREINRSTLVDATDIEIDRRTEARMLRTPRLSSEPALDFWAIVDEAVLRRPTGGTGVMLLQIDHLRELAERPNITLQILPTDVGAHPGMYGSFHVLEFPDPRYPTAVFVESIAGDLFVEDHDEVMRCDKLFNHLRSKALDRDRSLDLLTGILDELSRKTTEEAHSDRNRSHRRKMAEKQP
jgi:transcriptional regulator with XRE-family HTH domain